MTLQLQKYVHLFVCSSVNPQNPSSSFKSIIHHLQHLHNNLHHHPSSLSFATFKLFSLFNSPDETICRVNNVLQKNLFHMFLNLGRFDYKRTKFWRMAMGRRTNCIQHRRSWPRYLLRISQVFLSTIFLALIINLVGLGISTIVFVIEIIFRKTNKR